MKRPKNNGDENESASWMTTYSDMMTLLFAFFVLLFAISNVDSKKSQLLAAALSNKLTVDVFDSINAKYVLPEGSLIDMGLEPKPQSAEPEVRPGTYRGYLDELHKSVKDYIDTNNLSDEIGVERVGDLLTVTIKNDLWFEPGSAEINENMIESAVMLSQMFKEEYDKNNKIDIIVVGHTDNTPIHTPRYPSNWELSVDRAVSFLHILIRESGLSPSYFSARGYGEEYPIADNDTPEGRQKNRRVEILISESPK